MKQKSYAPYNHRFLKINFDKKGEISLIDVFCNSTYKNFEIALDDIESVDIVIRPFKLFYFIKVAHAAVGIKTKGNYYFIISAERKKSLKDARKLNPFKKYRFFYFAYCDNDYKINRGNFKAYPLLTDEKQIGTFLTALAELVLKMNKDSHKRFLFFNNCSKSVQDVFAAAFDLKVHKLHYSTWLVGALPRLIKEKLNNK